jgi:hypothetical protein
MISKEDDIIMLVVFGMLIVVLIAALISDTVSAHSTNNNKSKLKNSSETNEYEGFRIKKYNLTDPNELKYSNCAGCQRKFLESYEQFYNVNDINYEPNDGWLARRGLLPWWNSTRFTRNMSYDLRGDVPLFGTCTGLCCNPDSISPMPFWNSPIKPLC